jgi:hypothetical protein
LIFRATNKHFVVQTLSRKKRSPAAQKVFNKDNFLLLLLLLLLLLQRLVSTAKQDDYIKTRKYRIWVANASVEALFGDSKIIMVLF